MGICNIVQSGLSILKFTKTFLRYNLVQPFMSCYEIQNDCNFGSLYAQEKEINENMWMLALHLQHRTSLLNCSSVKDIFSGIS